jgi:hypothetical protein
VTRSTKHRCINRLRLGILLGAMAAALLMTFATPAEPNQVATVVTHVGAPVAVAHADTFTNLDDWDTMQYSAIYDSTAPVPGAIGHSGFNPQEALPLGTQLAPKLQLNSQWAPNNNNNPWVTATGAISSQPVVATVPVQSLGFSDEPVVFWGSWNGTESATLASNGAPLWTQTLGQFNTSGGCSLPAVGPAGAGAIGTMKYYNQALGENDPILVVAGPDASGSPELYGLDAVTGGIVWHQVLGPGGIAEQDSFTWGSPAMYQYGPTSWHIYVGISSFNDCPMQVQGQVIEVKVDTSTDPPTAQVIGNFATVPNGCTGGGVWSTPLIEITSDPTSPYIWVSTGNGNSCANGEPYALSLLELSGDLFQVLGSYQETQFTQDDDFGAPPTFFTEYLNGNPKAPIDLVGLLNKDGHFYVFNRATFKGTVTTPTYDIQLGVNPNTTQYGNGSIAAAAWDPTNNYLYIGVGIPAGNYDNCSHSSLQPTEGALYAFNLSNIPANAPTDAPFVQSSEVCFTNNNGVTPNESGNGAVVGSVVADPGNASSDPIAAVGEGQWLVVVDAKASPAQVVYYQDPNAATAPTPTGYASGAALSDGSLFIADEYATSQGAATTTGDLYSYVPVP